MYQNIAILFEVVGVKIMDMNMIDMNVQCNEFNEYNMINMRI